MESAGFIVMILVVVGQHGNRECFQSNFRILFPILAGEKHERFIASTLSSRSIELPHNK